MKKNKLLWILTLLPFVITCGALPMLPERIPMHYDLYGNIDRWGSKYEQLVLPFMVLGFSIFWQLFQNVFLQKAEKLGDSKEGREAASNARVISAAAIGTTLMFTVMNVVFLLGAYKEAAANATTASFDINLVMGVLMGLQLMVAGNYMPKTRRNGAVGFRTPKTTSSDENWAKANRFAGKVFVISGAVTVLLSLIFGGETAMLLFLGILLVDVVICLIYSAKLPS